MRSLLDEGRSATPRLPFYGCRGAAPRSMTVQTIIAPFALCPPSAERPGRPAIMTHSARGGAPREPWRAARNGVLT
jgi:hypothetical protein